MFNLFVIDIAKEFTMTELMEQHQLFHNFSKALYAVDVTFQQLCRPICAISKGKIFFGGKHILYGVKFKVKVLPNCLAVSCSNHCPGSAFSFEIIQHRRVIFNRLLSKKMVDADIVDIGTDVADHPNMWGFSLISVAEAVKILYEPFTPSKTAALGLINIRRSIQPPCL